MAVRNKKKNFKHEPSNIIIKRLFLRDETLPTDSNNSLNRNLANFPTNDQRRSTATDTKSQSHYTENQTYELTANQ